MFLQAFIADDDISSSLSYGTLSISNNSHIYHIRDFLYITDNNITNLRFMQPYGKSLQIYEFHESYIIVKGFLKIPFKKLRSIFYNLLNNKSGYIPKVNVILQNCQNNSTIFSFPNFKTPLGKTIYIDQPCVFDYVLVKGIYNLVISNENSTIFIKNLPLHPSNNVDTSNLFIDLIYTVIQYNKGTLSYSLIMFEIPLKDMKLALNYWGNFNISENMEMETRVNFDLSAICSIILLNIDNGLEFYINLGMNHYAIIQQKNLTLTLKIYHYNGTVENLSKNDFVIYGITCRELNLLEDVNTIINVSISSTWNITKRLYTYNIYN
ncbi:uncharacterized protein LOC135927216 isoform X1 [Gordionus sp. m RMFG-2023]|uniref:uncharacterized protein LOC135927216 isoform X1 n=1 Tax=Gordionus sp. m RMFG-2023 TaxID=3053472 RepID=UPI0031FCB9BF